jgi:hypothetical protein
VWQEHTAGVVTSRARQTPPGARSNRGALFGFGSKDGRPVRVARVDRLRRVATPVLDEWASPCGGQLPRGTEPGLRPAPAGTS